MEEKKMSKITVLNTKTSLDYIKIGEKISFKKIKGNAYDAHMIAAYYNGQEIGVVGATVPALIVGTVTNKEIYNITPDEFTGTVTNHGIATGAATKKVLEVTLDLAGASGTSNATGVKLFSFVCSGSATKYTGKSEVINEVQSGRRVFLQLKKIPDKNSEIVVVTRIINGSEVMCGKIDEGQLGINNLSSKEDLDLIKSILDTEAIECCVTSGKMTNFNIEISISNNSLTQHQATANKKALGSIKDDLIAKGFDAATIDNVETYLLANKFTSSMIQSIFETWELPTDPMVKGRIIPMPETLFVDNNNLLLKLYAATMNRYHVLLKGEKGTGKNTLEETWSWIIQRPRYASSINKETDKIDILGSKTFDSYVDENGNVIEKIVFTPEVLLEAMENGGVLNIDEINFADPGITGLLHSICDDRRTIEVPGYRKVSAHKNFMIIATMNVDYQGTNELNEALRDRFIPITFPNVHSIASVLMAKCPKAPKSAIQVCDNIYKHMCQSIESRDGNLDMSCMTVRGFIHALEMSAYMDLKTALTTCVADAVDDLGYREFINQAIELKCK